VQVKSHIDLFAFLICGGIGVFSQQITQMILDEEPPFLFVNQCLAYQGTQRILG
jgi:hypothetical protein